jgi:1-acyl-sn-glycerol-3-phosphate acyltransferase
MVYPFPSEEPTISYYNLGCAMVWPNLMLWTKRDWRGQRFLGNPGEGVVVAANHLSWFDPLLGSSPRTRFSTCPCSGQS